MLDRTRCLFQAASVEDMVVDEAGDSEQVGSPPA